MHWHKRLFASVISLAYIASRKWMQRARERPLWLCTLPISINKLIKIALPNWRIQSDVKLKKRHEFYDDRGKNRMRIRLLHKNRASTLHTNISVILVYGDFFLSANGFFSVASMQVHFFIAYAVFKYWFAFDAVKAFIYPLLIAYQVCFYKMMPIKTAAH